MIVRPVGSTPANLIGAKRMGTPRIIMAGTETALNPNETPKLLGKFPGVLLGGPRGENKASLIGASYADKRPFPPANPEQALSSRANKPREIGVSNITLGKERSG